MGRQHAFAGFLVSMMLVGGFQFFCSPFPPARADSGLPALMDITPPNAEAGLDQTVDEDMVVHFDGSSSTDDIGIVNYTWSIGNAIPDTPPKIRTVLPFKVTDAVFDPMRPFLYVSSKDSRLVAFVNLTSGVIEKNFTFTLMPESLAISLDSSHLFAALLTREHDSTWWDSDGHEGYIARFDLQQRVKEGEYRINEDPGDIVATGDNHLVVGGGSGQWTYIRMYNATTGVETGNQSSFRFLSRLTLHPSGMHVYSSSTSSSPGDVIRYNLTPGGGISYAWDSIYHGDYRMGGNAWVNPLGVVLITLGADVFTLGDSRNTDIIYLRGLTTNPVTDIAFDASGAVMAIGEGPTTTSGWYNSIHYYDTATYEPIAIQDVDMSTKYFLGIRGSSVYAVVDKGVQTEVQVMNHPRITLFGVFADYTFTEPGSYNVSLTVRDAAGNSDVDWLTVTVHDITAPIANAGADATISEGERFTFQGNGSSDNVGIFSFTWTFVDGGNVILNGINPSYRFNNPGVFTVVLEVQDASGNVATDTMTITVIPAPVSILTTYENSKRRFRMGVPNGWDVDMNFNEPGYGDIDLLAMGQHEGNYSTNLIVVSTSGAVTESDAFLLDAADQTIKQIRANYGNIRITLQPEVILAKNNRAVIFSYAVDSQSLWQFIGVVVSEKHVRSWVIVLTADSTYADDYGDLAIRIVRSFEVLPPESSDSTSAILLIVTFVAIIAIVMIVVALLVASKRRTKLQSGHSQSVALRAPPPATWAPPSQPPSFTRPPVSQGVITHPQETTVKGFCPYCGLISQESGRICSSCGRLRP